MSGAERANPLPLPPLDLRELVGQTDLTYYDNPLGTPIWDDVPAEAWRSYLDFGCGCGRSARRLIQQHPRPERYVGVDLHRGMIEWCRTQLEPHADGFTFIHHDVYSAGFNPDRTLPWIAPLSVDDASVTLMEATSVFTHLVEGQAEYYLDEVARVLAPDGMLIATWFLFDKAGFPFMQDNQNALYVNDRDPTNAVVFDRSWLQVALRSRGLALDAARPPGIRGYHWVLRIVRRRTGIPEVDLPQDTAPPGRKPPPLVRAGAHQLGLAQGAVDEVRLTARAEPPLPDPLAVELRNAKEYIRSLEDHLELARRARADPAP